MGGEDRGVLLAGSCCLGRGLLLQTAAAATMLLTSAPTLLHLTYTVLHLLLHPLSPTHPLQEAAAKAEGFDASDLQLLLDRAVHASLTRQLAGSCGAATPHPPPAQAAAAAAAPSSSGAVAGFCGDSSGTGCSDGSTSSSRGLCVSLEDLAHALAGFTPAAFWGVTQPAGPAGGGVEGWQDVGGLEEAVAGLQVGCWMWHCFAFSVLCFPSSCAPLLMCPSQGGACAAQQVRCLVAAALAGRNVAPFFTVTHSLSTNMHSRFLWAHATPHTYTGSACAAFQICCPGGGCTLAPAHGAAAVRTTRYVEGATVNEGGGGTLKGEGR